MRRVLVWALAAASLGCAELPDVPAGVCGNGVVESGEDCDTLDANCGAPESEDACRLLCTTNEECGGGALCGFDGVCRSPSGSFELVNEIGTPGAGHAQVADFDGDGVSDLLTFGSLQVRTLYLEESLGLISESTLPPMALAPAVGDLTTDFEGALDGIGDIVDLTTLGVSVFRGQPDQTFLTTSYSSLTVQPDTVTYAVVEARQPTGPLTRYFEADEVLRLSGTSLVHEIDGEKLFDLPFPATELRLPIGRADIDTQDDRGAGELVVAKKDGNLVYVLAVARPGLNEWNHDPGLHPTVKLPNNAKIKGEIFIQDVNGDAQADLLVSAAEQTLGLYVAFGLGDGRFHSAAADFPAPALPDQTFKLVAAPLPSPPLALGFLNDDGMVDAIFADRVLVSKKTPSIPDGDCYKPKEQKVDGYFCSRNTGPPWIDAIIENFNATPQADVALLRAGTLNVEFWNGLGGGDFSLFFVPTEGFPARLIAGDLDGDLLPDLAVLERSVPTEGGGLGQSPGDDTLSVLFSQPFGPPQAPQVFAELGSVEQVIVGRLDFAAADNLTDIGVLSTDEQGNRAIAVFQGSGSRLLQSPYRLALSSTDDPDLAMRASIGQFGVGGNDVAAVAFQGTAGGLQQRAWLLSGTDEAVITPSSVGTPLDLPEGFDACGALTLAVDIEGDGVSELVLLSRKILELERNNGAAVVLKASGEPPAFTIAQGPENVGYLFSAPFVQRLTCDQFRSALLGKSNPIFDAVGTGQVAAAELDGQPGKDVIALAPENETGVIGLVVYPGNADGTLNFGAPIVLTVPGAANLVGFAMIQADRDVEPELALITNEGLVTAELDLAAKTVAIKSPVVSLNFAGSFIGGKDQPQSLPGLGARDSRAFALLARDLDADGVEDLVLGFDGSLRILKGRESQ